MPTMPQNAKEEGLMEEVPAGNFVGRSRLFCFCVYIIFVLVVVVAASSQQPAEAVSSTMEETSV